MRSVASEDFLLCQFCFLGKKALNSLFTAKEFAKMAAFDSLAAYLLCNKE
jgi:hypothetical protein